MDEMKDFSRRSGLGYGTTGVQYRAATRTALPLWPTGRYWSTHDDLPGALAESGRWHARRALQNWATNDEHEALSAAVSAGCAVEHLVKAWLAKMTPALLLERPDLTVSCT